VVRVLYEAEAPVVYLSASPEGEPLLAYVADVSHEGVYTLVAATSPTEVAELEEGTVALRDALGSSRLWLHRFDGVRASVWACSVDEIPYPFLPAPGATLYPDRETSAAHARSA
jgi:hypothetical protein